MSDHEGPSRPEPAHGGPPARQSRTAALKARTLRALRGSGGPSAVRAGGELPVCHDLATWAAAHPGAQRWVIDPPFTVTRRPPRTIEPAVDPSFARVSTFAVPERALVKIPGARLRGAVGLVVLPTGEVVGETIALTEEGRLALLRGEEAFTRPLRHVRSWWCRGGPA